MTSENNMSLNILAAGGLAIGAIFGIIGSLITAETTSGFLYEISSLGMTMGCVLLGIKHFRNGTDLVAAGFILLALAEGVMTTGTVLGPVGGQPAFGAGMALYVPALLLISLPQHYAMAFRVTGFLACVPFGIAAARIFLGHEVLPSTPLPDTGYGLLTLTFVGWIIALFKGDS